MHLALFRPTLGMLARYCSMSFMLNEHRRDMSMTPKSSLMAASAAFILCAFCAASPHGLINSANSVSGAVNASSQDG